MQVKIVEEKEVSIQIPLYDVIDEMLRKVNDAAGFVISMEMNSEVGNVGAIVQGGGNVGDGQVPDQGEQRPDEIRPDRMAEAVRPHPFVGHIIFVVVIPDVFIAPFDQLMPYTVGPEIICVGIGKIQIASPVVPKGEEGRRAVFIMQKPPFLCEGVIHGVSHHKTGLYVREKFHPVCVKIFGQIAWRRDLVIVPVEDVTLAVNGSISAGKVKSAAVDLIFFTEGHEIAEFFVGVRRVGVVHGRAAVAQAPFRPEQRFPGQAHEGFGDVQHAPAGKDVVINIAVNLFSPFNYHLSATFFLIGTTTSSFSSKSNLLSKTT